MWERPNLLGENKEKFYGEDGIVYKYRRKSNMLNDREARFIEEATERNALESVWLLWEGTGSPALGKHS